MNSILLIFPDFSSFKFSELSYLTYFSSTGMAHGILFRGDISRHRRAQLDFEA